MPCPRVASPTRLPCGPASVFPSGLRATTAIAMVFPSTQPATAMPLGLPLRPLRNRHGLPLRATTATAMPLPRTIRHAFASQDPPCQRLGFSSVQPPDPPPSPPQNSHVPASANPMRRSTAARPARTCLSFPSALKQPSRAEEMRPQIWTLRAATRTAMQPPRTICHAPASHDPSCQRLGFPFVQPPDPPGPRLSFPSALGLAHKFGNAPTNLEATAMAPDLAMASLIWKSHNLRRRFGKHDLGTAITTTIPQMSRPPTSS
uniref:Uncharacterized protein n=1 Tax=Zea mays TaxID=4577 RepID=A0A804QH41_MAIZE